MEKIADGISSWLVTQICEHPMAVAVAAVLFLLCSLTVNGLRMAWPEEKERPRWVRFALGFLDLGSLNFWRLFHSFTRPDINKPVPAAPKP